MTRQDYETIAHVVKLTRSDFVVGDDYMDWHSSNIFNTLVRNLAKHLKNDNPRFDKARFVDACEFDGG